MKVSAIVVAGGKGERAGFNKNKVLAPIDGAPVLYHTLKKFKLCGIDEVITASSLNGFEEINAICAHFGYKTVAGGDTRSESVKNALAHVTGEIVLIHDGARPFVSQRLILKCIEQVKANKSAVPFITPPDTAVYTGNNKNERIDRNKILLLQTPQGFFTEDIKRAYSLAGGMSDTDDSGIYARFIGEPDFIEGEKQNIKLTYREDFERFRPVDFISSPSSSTGFGVDVHAFGEGDAVTLCGIKIPCDKGLIAHSDGDVAIHALMDALLSGAGLKDIGHYFPDTDIKYRNADSTVLLSEVMELIRQNGYAPRKISVSIQAEKPKLATYIDKMREKLGGILNIGTEDISISAGTCEKLGFVGEGLGITAYCAAGLRKLRRVNYEE